jgi:Peptidase A4 family
MRRRLFTVATAGFTGLLCAVGFAGTAGVAGAATGGQTSRNASVAQPGGPMVRAHVRGNSSLPTISINWSGYAAVAAKKFNYVHTRFVQPKVTCNGAPAHFTSNWSGLDGFTNGTVEQDGTFATCGGPANMTPRYVAWYEMFPANSVNVFTVKPGDVIDSSVRFAAGKFTLTIADLTSGKKVTKQAACSQCQRASAEWIVERPALCKHHGPHPSGCFIVPLANFRAATMRQDTARVGGGPVKGIGGFANSPIFMVNPLKSGGFISLDGVSPLSGPSFTATWERAGTFIPITLGPNN